MKLFKTKQYVTHKYIHTYVLNDKDSFRISLLNIEIQVLLHYIFFIISIVQVFF
jgi:hypothetical protein